MKSWVTALALLGACSHSASAAASDLKDKPLFYSQLRVEWPLHSANYEAQSSAQAHNASDAESLSFDPTWPLAVGVSLPVLSPLHLGLRMGAGEL
ncbi:MAG: hypothetical protein KC492_45760, partial [Myxococcales bacterium]|nr:hypothetical protein [Myxococcales bacterium]